MLKLGAGYIKPFAGVQYYTVEENGIDNITDDIDVLSWVLGVSSNGTSALSPSAARSATA